jgi:head-tail adaptor
MSYRALLDKTVTVKRETLTTDSQGGYARTWTVIYRRIPCRFQSLLNRETTLTYDKQTTFANFLIYFEALDIREGDRVYLDSRIFAVKLIKNVDEKNDMLTVAAVEVDRV